MSSRGIGSCDELKESLGVSVVLVVEVVGTDEVGCSFVGMLNY